MVDGKHISVPHAARSMDKRLLFPEAVISRDVGAQMSGFIRAVLMATIIMLLWISATYALRVLAAQEEGACLMHQQPQCENPWVLLGELHNAQLLSQSQAM